MHFDQTSYRIIDERRNIIEKNELEVRDRNYNYKRNGLQNYKWNEPQNYKRSELEDDKALNAP